MKEVIRLDGILNLTERPLEFTHHFKTKGWSDAVCSPNNRNFERVVYLGRCERNGDMFAVYGFDGFIAIYKGNINSGKY